MNDPKRSPQFVVRYNAAERCFIAESWYHNWDINYTNYRVGQSVCGARYLGRTGNLRRLHRGRGGYDLNLPRRASLAIRRAWRAWIAAGEPDTFTWEMP